MNSDEGVAAAAETKGLVNAAFLAAMKPKAMLINTARGEVVDQPALVAALQGGKLRAGLDVFDPEPAEAVADFNDPIFDLPNLWGTHHIGASTEQAQEAIAAFDRFEAEALVVVDSGERRQVIGLLSEAHALRRYSDASERQRRELLGEL